MVLGAHRHRFDFGAHKIQYNLYTSTAVIQTIWSFHCFDRKVPNNLTCTVKMNAVASGFNKKSSVLCQHGKDCQQTNPKHFSEYAHEHLDRIIPSNTTTNEVGMYRIPDGLTKGTIFETD